jgi:small subunit ribosomal protein S7e
VSVFQEIAQNFKEQGNDYFKGKRYREAIGFYTQGIDAKPTDGALIQALLSNRAACNLELSKVYHHRLARLMLIYSEENYGSVLRDCSSAITINSQSSKIYYRSSLALMALDRFEEALDCCDRCLQFDPNNLSVQSMRQKAHDAHNGKVKKEMERLDRVRKQKEEKKRLLDAFKVKGHQLV